MPRSNLQTSFAVSDAENVVVCPLKNHDGSSCRKRCFGEKRFRSMQEHIRRAHASHYIPKLPATEQSIELMINSTPSDRPPQPRLSHSPSSSYRPPDHYHHPSGLSPDFRPRIDSLTMTGFAGVGGNGGGGGGGGGSSSIGGSRVGGFNSYANTDGYMHADGQHSPPNDYRRGSILPMESAAAALAQLHSFRAEGPPMSGWDSEQVRPYFVFTAPPLFDSFDLAPAVAPPPAFTSVATLPHQPYVSANGNDHGGGGGATVGIGNGYGNGFGHGVSTSPIITTAITAAEEFDDNTFVHLQEPVYSDDERGGYPKSLSSRKNARFAPLLNEDEQPFDEDQFIHPDLGGTPQQQKRELLPSSMARSPPGRSSTLPPASRPVKPNRPRKKSVGQNAMKPKHERTKSKELQKRYSHERKAFSAEPQTAAAMGRSRWEDLIDAAASATEEDVREREDSRDRTPVPQGSPQLFSRSSIPPYLNASHVQSYTASPLARELTPPAQITDHTGPSGDLIPFPSVESSVDSSLSFSHSHTSNVSGSNFHIPPAGLSDSSPTHIMRPVEIYCALCKRPNLLRTTYACDGCICGLCSACVSVLEADRRVLSRHPGGGECPVCRSTDSSFKIVRFDVR